MHARGDMMPKPLNLTDMLWQKSEARAERAQEKGKLARPAATRPKAEFIPEAPDPKSADWADRADKAHRAGPKPFADRVRESQARLSGKDHSFFKQPARPEARGPESHGAENRPEVKASDSRNGRIGRDGRENGNAENTPAGQAARSEAAHARSQARKSGKADGADKADKCDKADHAGARAETWTPGESRPISLEAVEAEGTQAGAQGNWEDADLEGGMDTDSLQARLEELGIALTPEQLRDPAFLAEMLWMIDGIPMSLPLLPEAMPGEGLGLEAAKAGPLDPAAAATAATVDPLVDDAALAATSTSTSTPATGSAATPAAVPAEAFDWTAIEEPEREEIAALLREKLGALAEKPEFRAGPATAASAPAAAGLLDDLLVQKGRGEGMDVAVPKADLAMADPDRLRVLQTAGLNGLNGSQVPEKGSLHIDLDLENGDAADASNDPNPLNRVASADGKGGGGKAGDSLPDLLGRNPGQAVDATGLRESAAPKDASGTSAFQSAIDQARASEARLAQAKAPGMPMPQVHEQTVLAQIARKMSALGLRGTEEIRIQLEPEHLGRVRIALEMRDGGLTARIGVENDSVRQIVDANMAGLRTSLEEQGIKVQGMEVSVDQKHASLFNPDGSNAREFFRQRGQDGTAGQSEAGRDDSAESDTGRRMGYNTMEYIA